MTIWQSEVIGKLRNDLGDEDGVLVREIIQLYRAQAGSLLAQMEAASRQADEYQLRGLACSLKESSASIGGSRLAAVCDRIEHASSAELKSPAVWEDAQREFQLLERELASYLTELSATQRAVAS